MENMKVYKKRDFIYNNGLVNAFMYLENDEEGDVDYIDDYSIVWRGIKVSLEDDGLTFYASENALLDVYKFLIGNYYEEIMEKTKNKRLYVSEDLSDVIEGKKVNLKPFAMRSERMKDLQKRYAVEKVDDEKFSELFEIYEQKVSSGVLNKGQFWYGKKDKGLVLVDLPLEKIKEKLSNYVSEVKEGKEKCTICGSSYTIKVTEKGNEQISIDSTNMIYDFGNSTPVNRDHRLNYKQPLCFMCDLFYKIGMLNNYFYNASVFMFDSYSLRILKKIKEKLGINNDYVPVKNENIKTNMVGLSEIYMNRKYSQILGVVYFTYKRVKDKGNLIWDIGNSTLIKFDVNSDSIDNSVFYNKLSQEFRFLEDLEKNMLCCVPDGFFENLMRYNYYAVKNKNEHKVIYEDISKNILGLLPIEHVVFEASYVHFTKENGSHIKNYKEIKKFLKIYKNVRGDESMEYEKILDMCYALGDRIGYYAAEADEKNLVYQIREIGNLDKLVEFFREFEYSVLKNDRGDILNKVDEATGKKYSELIEEILRLAENRKNIPLMRDLLGIFAVQKYMATKYAKSKSEGGN